MRAAAETFRRNPDLNTEQVISELGRGEALVSFLEGNGTPSIVQRCLIRPPSGRVGAITMDERKSAIDKSPVRGKYDQSIDSESAYEVLQTRVKTTAAPPPGGQQSPSGGGILEGGGILGGFGTILGSIFGTSRPRGQRLSTTQVIAREVLRSVTGRVVGKAAADVGKSLGGSMGGSVGRAIVRGTLGGMLRR